MKQKTNISIVLLLSLCCCVSALSARRRAADNTPQWLTNPHARYPEAMYLVAIGEGDSRRRAEADAAANLAGIFETRVESEELYNERYKEIVSGHSAQAELITDIDRSVSLTAAQTLYNIQYADSYTDNMGRVFVLAYIDRHRTADIYMDMISRHNEQIKLFLDRAASSDNVLHSYAYRSGATVISTTNEVLLRQLQVIAPDYRAMLQLDYDHNELLMDTRNSAQNLRFSIVINNDRDRKLHSIFADWLTGQGFIVDEEGEITITGEVNIEDVDLQRQEKFVRWHLSIEMRDHKNQNVISHSQRGREGHINRSEAIARAFRAMEREIRQEFNRKFYSYFDNLVK